MSLIHLFKRQISKSIQGTLNTLAADNKIFSARLQPIAPNAGYHEYYIYMKGNKVVFMLWDTNHSNVDVLADEKFFYDEPPLYFTENSHWTSPVYLLTLLIHSFKGVIRKTNTKIGRVYGYFLTNSNLIYKEDMGDIWKWLEVVVADNVNMHDEIVINTNEHDKHIKLLEHFLNNANLSTWELAPKYDHTMSNIPPIEFPEDETAKKGY